MKLVLLLLALFTCSGYAQDQETCTTKFRLQDLGVSNAGRVEVCVDGVWGTVCTISERKQWSLKNAQVICQQLGYTTAVTSLPQDHLPAELRAGDSVPVHFTDVICNGTETDLEECNYSTDIQTECYAHFTDAAIVCSPQFDTLGGVTPGTVRLKGDVIDYRGAVEYYDGIYGWTGICADTEHYNTWIHSGAASVVCAQLGYEGGTAYVMSAPPMVDLSVAVDCRGNNAFSLVDCELDAVVLTGGCSSQDAGWIECRETNEADFTVSINGNDREGIVEVSYHGRWGTVCEDGFWFTPNAQVVCDELGLNSESEPSIYPGGNYDQYMSRLKPFWLSEVFCNTQTDSSLEECDRNLLIGYSSMCSNAFTDSVFNSAEIDCGDPSPSPSPSPSPKPNSLAGGQIAGIVIGVLAFVTIIVLIGIYGPDKWKKRHTYPWWRKLTTPSTWCNGVGTSIKRWCSTCRIIFPQRQTATIATLSSNENTEYPPATYTRTPQREEEPSTRTEPGQEQETQQQQRIENGANALLGFGIVVPPTIAASQDTDLRTAAPPTYQAAVSYPVAGIPLQDLPPAYSDEKGPPPTNTIKVLPYPTATTHDPAYPPPPPS